MIRAIIVFVLLNLADLLTSLCMFGFHPNVFYEFNPIARFLYVSFGWIGMSALKLASVAVLSAIAAYIATVNPRIAIGLVYSGSCIVGGAFFYSLILYAAGGILVNAVAIIAVIVALITTVLSVYFCQLYKTEKGLTDALAERVTDLSLELNRIEGEKRELRQKLFTPRSVSVQDFLDLKSIMTEGGT